MYDSDNESISSLESDNSELYSMDDLLDELNGEPMEVWMDRLVELAVDVYQKKAVYELYQDAYNQRVKSFCSKNVLNALEAFNHSHLLYLTSYYKFHTTFIVGQSRSESMIITEANTYFTEHKTEEDTHAFQQYMLDALPKKLTCPAPPSTPEPRPDAQSTSSPSTNVPRNSFFAPIATDEPLTQVQGYHPTV